MAQKASTSGESPGVTLRGLMVRAEARTIHCLDGALWFFWASMTSRSLAAGVAARAISFAPAQALCGFTCNNLHFGDRLYPCLDVANTVLVPAAMQTCATFARDLFRLTARSLPPKKNLKRKLWERIPE